MYHEIIVIGGGAAGIMSALTCKDNGKDVAILERNDRIAKKILSTGNGRCNISNENTNNSKFHSENIDFIDYTLNNFTVQDTKNFFEGLGLPLITLDDGKMYPMSLQASSVLDIFRFSIEDRCIPIYFNSLVKSIKKNSGLFYIETQDQVYKAKKVILATGGKSASNTGSDGSGLSICKDLGHNIISPIPGLVQLKLEFKHLKALSGIKFNGFCEIYIDDICTRKEFGELLFTDYGISGPPILQISGLASKTLYLNKKVYLAVDMMPNFSKESLEEFLENHWGCFGYRSVIHSFIGIINKKMIPILLKYCHIDNIHKPCYDLTWEEKSNLISTLKKWSFKVTDTNPFRNSQITYGGVDTTEVFSNSLESKKISDLYFCGEILDVQGDCGGYNLQWAWSSGYLAAKSATLKE